MGKYQAPEYTDEPGPDNITDRVYIGGLNHFGYLEKDSKGINNYISISNDSSDIGIISGIHFEVDKIIFYGDESVSIYDRGAENISRHWLAERE